MAGDSCNGYLLRTHNSSNCVLESTGFLHPNWTLLHKAQNITPAPVLLAKCSVGVNTYVNKRNYNLLCVKKIMAIIAYHGVVCAKWANFFEVTHKRHQPGIRLFQAGPWPRRQAASRLPHKSCLLSTHHKRLGGKDGLQSSSHMVINTMHTHHGDNHKSRKSEIV